MGEAVRASGVDRRQLFITTKLWMSDYGYERTLRAFDVSLRKLGVDYLDLSPAPLAGAVEFRNHGRVVSCRRTASG